MLGEIKREIWTSEVGLCTESALRDRASEFRIRQSEQYITCPLPPRSVLFIHWHLRVDTLARVPAAMITDKIFYIFPK